MLLTPHEPSDACGSEHCFSCNVDEPIPAGAQPYIVCTECGHVYWKPRDLLRRYRQRLRQELSDPRFRPRWRRRALFDVTWKAWLRHYLGKKPDQITFCQECSHDF